MTQLTEDFKFSTAFVLLKQTSAILFRLRNILKFLSDCFMDLRYFWLSLFLVCGLWSGAFCDQDGIALIFSNSFLLMLLNSLYVVIELFSSYTENFVAHLLL